MNLRFFMSMFVVVSPKCYRYQKKTQKKNHTIYTKKLKLYLS